MDPISFADICLHQLKMSGVHEGEKVVVLTQGNERLDYADAFMAAGQKLGARMYHMRLPAPPPMGGWVVGPVDSGLGDRPGPWLSGDDLGGVSTGVGGLGGGAWAFSMTVIDWSKRAWAWVPAC